MRVAVGDVELYVHDKGEGRPIVALHGGPGLDGSTWFPGLDPVVDLGYRVLAPDHRGNGRSDAGDPARWTVPQMADDVEALIDALGLENAVVIGWSFGSFVAQSHMARHGSASAYVLMGTVSHPGALANVAHELAIFEPDRFEPRWLLPGSSRRPSRRPSRRSSCSPTRPRFTSPTRQARSWRSSSRPTRSSTGRTCCGTSQPAGSTGWSTSARRFARWQTPTLILSGANDRTTPAASAHELTAFLPHCEEIVIPNCAHMVPYEQPDAFLAALTGFLARH